MEGVWWTLGIVRWVLAPVVLGVVLALVRGNGGRAVFTLAVAAVVLLIVGVGIYDVLTGLRSVAFYSRSPSPVITFSRVTLNVDAVHLGVTAGETVLVAATALALHGAARTRRWIRFAALLMAHVLAAVFPRAFNPALDVLFFTQRAMGRHSRATERWRPRRQCAARPSPVAACRRALPRLSDFRALIRSPPLPSAHLDELYVYDTPVRTLWLGLCFIRFVRTKDPRKGMRRGCDMMM